MWKVFSFLIFSFRWSECVVSSRKRICVWLKIRMPIFVVERQITWRKLHVWRQFAYVGIWFQMWHTSADFILCIGHIYYDCSNHVNKWWWLSKPKVSEADIWQISKTLTTAIKEGKSSETSVCLCFTFLEVCQHFAQLVKKKLTFCVERFWLNDMIR